MVWTPISTTRSSFWWQAFTVLCFFTAALVAIFKYIELAKRTSCVHVQPLVYADRVKMVTTRELTQLNSIFIGTKADATFLQQTRMNEINSYKRIGKLIPGFMEKSNSKQEIYRTHGIFQWKNMLNGCISVTFSHYSSKWFLNLAILFFKFTKSSKLVFSQSLNVFLGCSFLYQEKSNFEIDIQTVDVKGEALGCKRHNQ